MWRGRHPHRGTLRIGDALTEGEDIQFLGIPSFAPEILRRIRLEDAIRAKKLKEALREMAEEGVVQVFSPLDGSQPVVGVIGALQLDVLAARLQDEYGLPIGFDPAPCDLARWIKSDDPGAVARFIASHRSRIAIDLDGDHVFLPLQRSRCRGPRRRAPRYSFPTSRRSRSSPRAGRLRDSAHGLWPCSCVPVGAFRMLILKAPTGTQEQGQSPCRRVAPQAASAWRATRSS